jgi:hypothetical protein
MTDSFAKSARSITARAAMFGTITVADVQRITEDQ